jgi:hypothetical protein
MEDHQTKEKCESKKLHIPDDGQGNIETETIINPPVSYLKHDVPQAGFCLHLQVKT